MMVRVFYELRSWFSARNGSAARGYAVRCGQTVTHMVSRKLTIKNPTGLHLRPAGILCKTAMDFKSLITFQFRGTTANAKSVLSVLGACVKSGDEIELFCDGPDEEEALATLTEAIESGLGE